MNRDSYDLERWRALQEKGYERIRRAVSEDRLPVHCLASPRLSPCTLRENQFSDGVWYTITLGHGSWDAAEEHVLVTTSRDLPGQEPSAPLPPAFTTLTPEHRDVRVDDAIVPGDFRRRADAWLLTATVDGWQVTVSGRGEPSDLTLRRMPDIDAAIDERRRVIEARRPARGGRAD